MACLALFPPLLFIALLGFALASHTSTLHPLRQFDGPMITPKVFIISMWSPEAQIWHDRLPSSGLGNLTATRIFIPGLSPIYPYIYCTSPPNDVICQLTTAEGEINAAASMTALILSPRFDLRKTYFLFAGIGGVNPRHATLGGVALARYAVQVALQYEIDARSTPDGWETGYFAYGTDRPFQHPSISYGTEVFELSTSLRDMAYTLASSANLTDAPAPQAYRTKYASMGEGFAAAMEGPKVVRCDTATSDVYYSGRLLAEAFENTTSVWTNGTGVYCMTAQEDNANLEVMVRAAIEGLVDFGRIIVMRTGSNFDRPPPGVSDWEHLALSDQNGFSIAIDNIYNAGMPIVRGLLDGWGCTFEEGVEPENYIGDIFGSLGGRPDFGKGSITGGARVAAKGGLNDHGDDGRKVSPEKAVDERRWLGPGRRRRRVPAPGTIPGTC